MHGWQGLVLVTAAALIVAIPWVRVAIARDQAAVIKELRGAAIVMALAIGVLWAGWIFSWSASVTNASHASAE